MGEPPIVLNGVDAATGQYLMAPMDASAVYRVAKAGELPGEEQEELRWWHHQIRAGAFGPKAGVDPTDLAEAGWGVVFAADADPAVRQALAELLTLRRSQAGAVVEQRYREFWGPDGYRAGESKRHFLNRHGVGPGPADPDIVPYYLLLVGSPAAIPYRFQHQLDVQYAVGRLDFDTVEEYAAYAGSVVAAETTDRESNSHAVFLGTRHEGDTATNLSSSLLVTPVAREFDAHQPTWTVESMVGDAVTKATLLDHLGGDATPSLLFTATHGVGYAADDPKQRAEQGALLAQDWPGLGVPAGAEHVVRAEDVGDDADVAGLIAFFFACFGGGTPSHDSFANPESGRAKRLAPEPFTARLPQRLAAHPNGGALAVVAHIDRAWSYSFHFADIGPQTQVFDSTLHQLASGYPVGAAVEFFNERYAEQATVLSYLWEDERAGERIDPYEVLSAWTVHNDARGFTIFGDPATRVPPTEEPAEPPAPIRLVASPEPSPTADEPGDAVDFGLRDDMRALRERVGSAVRGLADELADAVGSMASSATTLNVTTYVADDLDAVTYDREQKRLVGDLERRAVSRTRIDGDTEVVVARERAEDDADLWKLHVDVLREVRQAHADLLGIGASALTALLEGLKS